jgi:hypothetical protein
MKNLHSYRRTLLACMALAVLAACGQTQPAVTSPAVRLDRRRVPLTGQNLLYVSAWLTSRREVYILTYPQGKMLGTLSGLQYAPYYLCSDTSGNVFVTADITVQSGVVYEFAHGATVPFKTLSDPGMAFGCAVDPASGDLAVANFNSPFDQKGDGDIVIYPHGGGSPKIYGTKKIQDFRFCAYDSNGNLLADGVDQLDQNVLVILPRGARSLTVLTFKKSINEAGPIQWDGQYFAVGFLLPHKIYQVSVLGSHANATKTILLTYRRYELSQEFWLYDNTLVATIGRPNQFDGSLGFWNYPAGGNAKRLIRTLSGAPTVVGVTVSAAQSR